MALSCNYSCSGKAMYITYSECAPVALGIQHAMRIRQVILSSVAFLTLPHFSASCHKLHDFLKKKRKNYWTKKCVLWFSLNNFPDNFFFILRRMKRDTIINSLRFSCKVPVILIRYYWNLNFFKDFCKNTVTCSWWKVKLEWATYTVSIHRLTYLPQVKFSFYRGLHNTLMELKISAHKAYQRPSGTDKTRFN